MSAVSIKLIPASRAASTTARVPSRSTGVLNVVPKLLAPRPTTETSSLPIRRRCTSDGSAHRALLGPHRGWGLTPRGYAVLGQSRRHAATMYDGPVGVVELVQREAGPQGVVEAHVVDRLVHR